MRYRNEDRYSREIQHPMVIGITFLIVFCVAFSLLYHLHQKSVAEISNNYEILEAVVQEKHAYHNVRSSDTHYVQAKTSDGHEQSYWVTSKVYESVDVGDRINVYKYKNYYGTRLSIIVEDNAGILYTILESIICLTATISVAFIIIGIIQKFKNRSRSRRGRQRRYHL